MSASARHRSEHDVRQRPPRATGQPSVLVPAPRRESDPLPAPADLHLERPREPRSRTARVLMAILACLVLVPMVALVVLDLRVTTALGRIDGAFDGLGERRPAATDGSVTMLMLATGDAPDANPSLAWMPQDPDVVSAMVVTISGDRLGVDVDWLPLRGAIRRGLEESQASGSVAAVENWTDRRVDHLAVVDWAAFADLGGANGGPSELPGPGRGQQQAFLRGVLENTLHAEMRKEPWTLYRALHTVAEQMSVEEGWSTYGMNRLVFSLRDLRSAQITFGSLDAPVTG